MRPAGLTAVCILSLVFGVLGGFSFVGGVMATFLQPVILDMTEWMQAKIVSAQPPQMQQQFNQQLAGQQQMMRETVAVQRRWMPVMLGSLLIVGAAAVALIVGAIKGLGLKPRAHHWLIAGMAAGILHALLSGYVGAGIQQESQVITMRYVNQTLQASPGGANPAARAMTTNFAQAGTAIGMAFIFGWALLKCGIYAVGIGYLLTPRIRQLFEGDGSERAIIDALSAKPS
ncbi:MAG: hypothetical protein JNG89_05995 [Planctomycetaceae bacterium]|nr:hypothetical protein [Planctomycetaceae bacterium]